MSNSSGNLLETIPTNAWIIFIAVISIVVTLFIIFLSMKYFNIREIISGSSWKVFITIIPILLTLSILFFSMESSYRRSYTSAEFNIMSYTFTANSTVVNSTEYTNNRALARFWVETAVDYKDAGEQRAYSARLLFGDLAISVILIIVLLIIFIFMKLFTQLFPGALWQWVQISILCIFSLVTLIFMSSSFISAFSPNNTPRILGDISIIKIQENQNIKQVFDSNPWLIEHLDNYMDKNKAEKEYFGLSSYLKRYTLNSFIPKSDINLQNQNTHPSSNIN
jgi:hypothetical protein